jgi:hypothetical protein
MERKLKEIEMQVKLFLQSASADSIEFRGDRADFRGGVESQILKLSLSYLHVGEYRLNYIRF